jgi:hypothetical protein
LGSNTSSERAAARNESRSVELPAEFFNVFNHPSFVGASMGTDPTVPFSYGNPFTAENGREIRLALKPYF